jgi:hypothetical protein
MAATRRVQTVIADFLRMVRDQLGAGRLKRSAPVSNRETLERFLDSRASHVAQSSLYGYLRTRAGTRYPQLFADENFSKAIEIAKWYVWLACLSDLALYAGGLLAQRTGCENAEVRAIIEAAVDSILAARGVPEGAGPEFSRLADAVRARFAQCDWTAVSDDETPFTESPTALVQWAPVFDDLKQLDEEIVRNSIRFRWQEVRRELRSSLAAEGLCAEFGVCRAPARAS